MTNNWSFFDTIKKFNPAVLEFKSVVFSNFYLDFQFEVWHKKVKMLDFDEFSYLQLPSRLQKHAFQSESKLPRPLGSTPDFDETREWHLSRTTFQFFGLWVGFSQAKRHWPHSEDISPHEVLSWRKLLWTNLWSLLKGLRLWRVSQECLVCLWHS